MDTRIMIRDGGPYGPDLSLPAAIARLCDGEQVTVTPVDASTPGGDPRGEPRHGFDITVYPARTAYTRQEPPEGQLGRHRLPPGRRRRPVRRDTDPGQPARHLRQPRPGHHRPGGGDRRRGRPGRRPAGTGREHTRDLPGHRQGPR